MGKTGTVTVTAPAGREVYINGNYATDPDFPQTIPYTFEVEYGANIFETLDAARQVDYRATVVTDDGNIDCSTALTPLAPAPVVAAAKPAPPKPPPKKPPAPKPAKKH